MFRIIFFSVFAYLAGCSSVTALETTYIPFENKGWKVGYVTDTRYQTLVEFVPDNETVLNWSRMLNIQFFEGVRKPVQQVMPVLMAGIQRSCPDVTWFVLSEDSASVTYEWSVENCKGQDDQTEIVRLLQGNDGVQRIAFVCKSEYCDPQEQAIVLDYFSKAYVEKNGKKITLKPKVFFK